VRRQSGDVRRQSGDVRRQSGDVRRQSGDVRRQSGDVRRQSGVASTSSETLNNDRDEQAYSHVPHLKTYRKGCCGSDSDQRKEDGKSHA